MQRTLVQSFESIFEQVMLNFDKYKNIYFIRNSWILEDDVKLLIETRENPKNWAKISRKFKGRTQHQIKNRFICILTKELSIGREKIRQFINKNCLYGPIAIALEALKSRMEVPEESTQNSGIMEENSSYLCDVDFEVEKFINYNGQKELFVDFE